MLPEHSTSPSWCVHPTAGGRHPLERHCCAQWVSDGSIEGVFRDCWGTPESLSAAMELRELSSPATAIPHFQMFSFAWLWGKACWISALATGSAGLLPFWHQSYFPLLSIHQALSFIVTIPINIITDVWRNLPNTVWLILITSSMLP